MDKPDRIWNVTPSAPAHKPKPSAKPPAPEITHSNDASICLVCAIITVICLIVAGVIILGVYLR